MTNTPDPLLPPNVRAARRFDTARPDRDEVSMAVAEELAFHLDMRIRELEAAGLSHDDATRQASAELGDRDDVRRHALVVSSFGRRRRRWRQYAADAMHEGRTALRQLSRARLAAIATILTLAIGLGANGAMFSIVHRLIIDALPFPNGDRMALVKLASGPMGFDADSVVANVWRTRSRLADAWLSWKRDEAAVDDGRNSEMRMPIAVVDEGFAAFVGRHVQVGRDFAATDVVGGAEPTAIVSNGLSRQLYGQPSDALGRRIRVDGVDRRIIGVAAPGASIPFDESPAPSIWLPVASSAATPGFHLVVKTRPSVTMSALETELFEIARSIPLDGRQLQASAARALRPNDLLGATRSRAIVLLFAATALLLTIACVNAAHLLLVRAWARQREFAIRRAIGGSGRRLAAQLTLESLLLATVGGAGAVGLAWLALKWLPRLRPQSLDVLDRVGLQPATVGWTCAIAILAGLAFGAAPALFAGRESGASLLRTSERSGAVSLGARRIRRAFVITELSLSVVLLVAAALIVRSYLATQRVRLGFAPHRLVAVRVSLPRGGAPAATMATWHTVLERTRAIPGVDGATLGSLPMDIGLNLGGVELADGSLASRIPMTGLFLALPNYFQVAGIHVRGSTFTGDPTSTRGSDDEIIINERLAQRLWPNTDPIGQRLRMGPTQPPRRVVGVANDVVVPGRSGPRYELQVYLPPPVLFASTEIVLRTTLSAQQLRQSLNAMLAAEAPGASIASVTTAEFAMRALLANARFALALIVTFASIATVLSAIGLYGVIAYMVERRTHEFGVRVALGARSSDIRRLVAQESGWTIVPSLAIGLVVGVAGVKVLRRYVDNIDGTDPLSYLCVAAIVVAIALLATFGPMRRALQVDPVRALNTE